MTAGDSVAALHPGEGITARAALRAHLGERGLGQGCTPEDWYRDPWFRMSVRGVSVPLWPKLGFRSGLPLHDLHHLITGYETNWPGELEIAAWELGSGGCGWRLVFWIDRILMALLGVIFMPRRASRAFQGGTRCRNLFRLRTEHVLEAELEALRERVFLVENGRTH